MNPKRNVEDLHNCKLSLRRIATEMLNSFGGEAIEEVAISLFSIANDIDNARAKIYELYDVPAPKEDDIPF